jgi:hypothetical protein
VGRKEKKDNEGKIGGISGAEVGRREMRVGSGFAGPRTRFLFGTLVGSLNMIEVFPL